MRFAKLCKHLNPKHWDRWPNLLLVVSILMLSACNVRKADNHLAVKGVLDLRNWHYDNNIELNGEWEFTWNQSEPRRVHSYSTVPGVWNKLIVNQQKLPSVGSANYRLRILNCSTKSLLSLKVLDVSSSYELFVNNTLIGTNGHFSTSPDSMVADYRPKIFSFLPESDTTDVLLKVANAVHYEGGIRAPILLGTQQAILHTHNLNYIVNLLIAGIMLILFLYHLWMYTLRRKDTIYLAFGVLCFCVLVRSCITNERFFQIIKIIRKEWLT